VRWSYTHDGPTDCCCNDGVEFYGPNGAIFAYPGGPFLGGKATPENIAESLPFTEEEPMSRLLTDEQMARASGLLEPGEKLDEDNFLWDIARDQLAKTDAEWGEENARLREALEAVIQKSEESIERLRRHGYVFQRAPSDSVQRVHELSDGERWEHMAFALYLDLGELAQRARLLLGEGE
jgi:hypothetical protein